MSIRVSASQVSTFDDCAMKWFLAYCNDLKTPGGPATKLGKCLHTVQESHLIREFGAEGEKPDIETIIRLTDDNRVQQMHDNSLETLQGIVDNHPEGKYIVEMKMEGELTKGITYLGFIDWVIFDFDNKIIYVLDHKTSGSPQYFLNEFQLKKNQQLCWYMWHIWKEHLRMQRFQLKVAHIQYHTKRPHSVSLTSTDITIEEIDKVMDGVVVTAKDMLELKEKYKDNLPQGVCEVPKTVASCSKYGGCPYMPICHDGMTPEEFKDQVINGNEKEKIMPTPLESGNDGKKLSFKERMEVKRKEAAIAAKEAEAQEPEKKEEEVTKEPEKSTIEIDEKTEEKTTKKKKAPKKKAPLDGTTILVNCMPATGEDFVRLADIIRPCEEALAEEYGVSDIRMVEFNKAINAMSQFGKDIAEIVSGHTYVFVDERNPVEVVVLQTLKERYFTVIRGVAR